MLFYDTETCGFKGPLVLIQYAENDGKIHQISAWKDPIENVLDFIEYMMDNDLCAFNMVFDHFQLCKIYNMFRLLPDKSLAAEDYLSELSTQEWHEIEKEARDGLCLRPKSCLDIMLVARKGPYQSTMDRKDIVINRVPSQIADLLAEELEERVKLKDIYFSRFSDKLRKHWQVEDIKDSDGEAITEFKKVTLRFRSSSALKSLAVDALGLDEREILRFGVIGVAKAWLPNEHKYVPFGSDWPRKIHKHISYWAHNPLAKKYAGDDVKYLRDLYYYFECPESGDVDSELAAMVAAVRWKGFTIDVDKLVELRTQMLKKAAEIPTAPKQAKAYVSQHMNEFEQAIIKGSTKKVVLQEIVKWRTDIGDVHPAAVAANEVLEARQAEKEVDMYNKLIDAGRFHAGFNIIGTKSTRMSGSDGLNPQGIKKDNKVRKCFGLAPDGMILCGGDFDAFEVCLAEAEYGDAELREVLLSGKKIHAIFATYLYPGSTYEEIMEENKKDIFDSRYVNGTRYKDGKQGIFGQIYGGDYNTLVKKLGIPEDIAKKADMGFRTDFPGIARSRKEIEDNFCSMTQPKGIGTEIIWRDPKDYVESMFGFKRYFTLENQICKALFELAQKPPQKWHRLKGRVVRRERVQTVSGATLSAVYGAAFNIQAQNMRAAANHKIQSSGATITKELQYNLWELQPRGISEFRIMPLNIHDEIMAPMKPELTTQAKEIVDATIEKYREHVPLLAMDWKTGLKSWGEK